MTVLPHSFRVPFLTWALMQLSLHAQTPPAVDHHQHLFSLATTAVSGATLVSAEDLALLLDEGGIRGAVVLSLAYQYGNPNRPPVEDEYTKVKSENDWTSQQVAQFPERLRGFGSVNPLKEYAVKEVDRCAQDPFLRTGLKLHFGNSDVDLLNPEHVAKLRAVFRAANRNKMSIVVHLRSNYSHRRPHGAEQAQSFLDNVLTEAPDVTVQIAHLAGAGGYDEPSTDQALGVFIDAIAASDPRTQHLYFDVSGVAGIGEWPERAELIVSRLRQIGFERILFGSDGTPELLRPRDAWADFCKLPLSESELRTIRSNKAPYFR
ncbi:MAG: hypothetical protein SynsKO_39220 [Synoicihabitans sp.]